MRLFLEIFAEVLQQIIRFLYCGKIFLSRLNVREILQSADYFGIDILVAKCSEFYAKNLDMDYNLAMEIRNVWRTGGHSSLKMALKKANRYLKVNLFSKDNIQIEIQLPNSGRSAS